MITDNLDNDVRPCVNSRVSFFLVFFFTFEIFILLPSTSDDSLRRISATPRFLGRAERRDARRQEMPRDQKLLTARARARDAVIAPGGRPRGAYAVTRSEVTSVCMIYDGGTERSILLSRSVVGRTRGSHRRDFSSAVWTASSNAVLTHDWRTCMGVDRVVASRIFEITMMIMMMIVIMMMTTTTIMMTVIIMMMMIIMMAITMTEMEGSPGAVSFFLYFSLLVFMSLFGTCRP